MKTIFGFLLILAGIVLGVYVGVWVLFIGGIIDCVSQLNAHVIDLHIVAWGIAKIIFSGFLGWLTAVSLIFPGIALLGD